MIVNGYYRLPSHAQPFLGRGAGVNWALSRRSTLWFRGLAAGGLQYFPRHDGSGKIEAVIMETDCDIDADGPGGSKAEDPYWLPETTLRWKGGSSCNSREFLGYVLPPDLYRTFGFRPGDYGVAVYNGRTVACQFYDVGPNHKVGEVSVALARELGIPADPVKGNNVRDLVIIGFPGSGPKRAVDKETQRTVAFQHYEAFLKGGRKSHEVQRQDPPQG